MNWEDHVERGPVLMTDGTQTICLPNSMCLPDGVTSVDITKQGRALIIGPSKGSWAEWFEGATVSEASLPSEANSKAKRRTLFDDALPDCR
jgi:virulence-associated protein VagC